MTWRRRPTQRAGVEIDIVGRGLLLRGTDIEIRDVLARLVDVAPTATRSISGADLLGVAGAALGTYKTGQQYLEFSTAAMKKVAQFGLTGGPGNTIRSYVVDKAGRFAGNLDLKTVTIGPSRALSIQTAATTLALRAAIKDVAVAIERVEGKVDELVALARADRLGTAVGDRRSLQAAVDLLRTSGRVTTTDWIAIGSLGPQIARDIERLRGHIVLKLAKLEAGAMVRSRVDAAEQLSNGLLRESTALLVLAEHNVALWQELRMAHTDQHERRHLQGVVADAQQQLACQYAADQSLLDKMSDAVHRLTRPTGFEGYEPLQRRDLTAVGHELDTTLAWFADQRNLDTAGPHALEYSNLRLSITRTGRIAAGAIQSAVRTIGSSVERIHGGRH